MLPADIAALVSRTRGALVRSRVIRRCYRCITSTNDVAARLADAGAAEGTWVVADEQKAGRGRRGRTWASPPGAGLYLVGDLPAFVASPPSAVSVDAVRDDRITSLLTLMAGVAAAQGVRAATGLAPGLKWPNDLVIEPPGERSGFSRFRKLAGILAEGSASGGELQSVVIGIGINLTAAAYPPDVEARATSIEGELGRPVDRAAVLVEVLAALAAWRRRAERWPSARAARHVADARSVEQRPPRPMDGRAGSRDRGHHARD